MPSNNSINIIAQTVLMVGTIGSLYPVLFIYDRSVVPLLILYFAASKGINLITNNFLPKDTHPSISLSDKSENV